MTDMRIENVGIVGLGYVGLPLVLAFAASGLHTVGYDTSVERVHAISQGRSPIGDVTDAALTDALTAGSFLASCDSAILDGVDAAIICVPTPVTAARSPDISFIEEACNTIAHHLHRGELVVLESTSFPGTTEEVALPILESKGLKAGRDFWLAFSPERTDPGNKTYGLHNTPKIVGGIDKESTSRAAELYGSIVPEVVKVSSTQAAEMAKLLENTFRLVNVSLVNELAMFCERTGLDIWEVIGAAKTKPYGFMAFYPGPGIGGHCIPVDPFYLLWKAKLSGLDLTFVEAAERTLDGAAAHLVELVMRALNSRSQSLKGAKVLLLGVAYKKNIGDLRESPAIKAILELEKWGAEVTYYDAHVPSCDIDGRTLVSLPKLDGSELSAVDCVVVMTDHTDVNYDTVVQNARLVVDTRGICSTPHDNVWRLGDGTHR